MATMPTTTDRWVCLEIFGHRQHFGRLVEVEQFGAKFARIEMLCPKGHLVDAPIYAGAAVFSITDVAEEDARQRNRFACPHADCRQPTPSLPAHDYDDPGANDEEHDPPRHDLLECAVAFLPTVLIGNVVTELLLRQNEDESFGFHGPRAAVLGLDGDTFDTPEDAMDCLRALELREQHNVELGEKLAAADEVHPRTPIALVDEIDRIFPGEPGRARELLAELRSKVACLEVTVTASEEAPVARTPREGFDQWLRDCGVVGAGGAFNDEQARLELQDYHFLLGEVPKVYYAISDGKLSKVNYTAETMIREFEDYVSRMVREAVAEGREQWEEERAAATAEGKTCEGCGCVPCAGMGPCPGKMRAPTTAVTPEDAAKLLAAARVLVGQGVGDYTYSVRERECLGWDGPLVKGWSDASVALAEVVKKYPAAAPDAPAPAPDPTDDVRF